MPRIKRDPTTNAIVEVAPDLPTLEALTAQCGGYLPSSDPELAAFYAANPSYAATRATQLSDAVFSDDAQNYMLVALFEELLDLRNEVEQLRGRPPKTPAAYRASIAARARAKIRIPGSP